MVPLKVLLEIQNPEKASLGLARFINPLELKIRVLRRRMKIADGNRVLLDLQRAW